MQKVVRAQPGLISLESLSDVNDHHKYVMLSEVSRSLDNDAVLALIYERACGVLFLQWKSLHDYNAWTSSEAYKQCTEQINEVLDVPGKRTTIYKQPKDDIFLL